MSSAYKLVSELSLDRGENFGIFVRGSALYDTLVEDSKTDRTPISEAGKDLAGSYLRLLDAFAWGRWDIGGHDLDIRAGRQVVNWGESTFIQGGINNAINHFDVSALRAPGSELREAYLPQEMLKVGLRGDRQRERRGAGHRRLGLDAARARRHVFLHATTSCRVAASRCSSASARSRTRARTSRRSAGRSSRISRACRAGETNTPSDSGQYGAALRWYLPDFAQGTEFGFYFVNYHSKLPVISGRTGTQAGIGNSLGTLTASIATAQGLASGLPFDTAVAIAANAGANAAAANGGDLSLETAAGYATIAGNTALGGGNVTSQATNSGDPRVRADGDATSPSIPEDIQLFGVSFNSQLGTTGIALQGEVSYRMDTPLQFDDVEVVVRGADAVRGRCARRPGHPDAGDLRAAGDHARALRPARRLRPRPGRPGLGRIRRLAGPDDRDQGVSADARRRSARRRRRGGHDPRGKHAGQDCGGPNGRGLRLNGPGTSVSGNAELAGRHFGEVEPLDRFADANSWGYRMALRLDYLGLIGAWNFSPRFVWAQDVDGTSPGPGGNFVEGRTGATFGVLASYQSSLEFDVSYTTFGGAGRYNELGDRDFLAANIKYSF